MKQEIQAVLTKLKMAYNCIEKLGKKSFGFIDKISQIFL